MVVLGIYFFTPVEKGRESEAASFRSNLITSKEAGMAVDFRVDGTGQSGRSKQLQVQRLCFRHGSGCGHAGRRLSADQECTNRKILLEEGAFAVRLLC